MNLPVPVSVPHSLRFGGAQTAVPGPQIHQSALIAHLAGLPQPFRGVAVVSLVLAQTNQGFSIWVIALHQFDLSFGVNYLAY